jgi:transglutaminase-like putative cysteine protease
VLLIYRWPLQRSGPNVNKLKRINLVAALILLLLLISIKQSGVFHFMLQILLLSAASRMVLIRQRHDSHQLLWVLYFLLACCFIFYQSIVLSLIILALLLFTLYHHYQLYASKQYKLQLRQLGKALLMTFPVWISLFLLFPRLQPLWRIPTADAAITGLSDSLDPGSIENLVQTDTLAFRAIFNGPLPARQQLYWRAKVYEDFDGRRWTVNPRFENRQPTGSTTRDENTLQRIDYQIIAEVSNQRSLFALGKPVQFANTVRPVSAFLIEARRPVSQRLSYLASSMLSTIPEDNASEQRLNMRTVNANPQTRALAIELANNTSTTVELIAEISALFRQQPYFYSLNPPRLGTNSIDTFLFNTRTGFCSHYASATAVLLREAGVPARVVGGYQGGVWHEDQQYLEVRQREAHAWVEYFDKGAWQRFDPTAVIAPERVLAGLDAVLSTDEQNQLQANWRRFSTFNYLNQQLLHLDYYWSVWVLGFDDSQQYNLWQHLKAMSKLLAVAGALILFSIIIWWYLRYQRQPVKYPAPVLLTNRYFGRVLRHKPVGQHFSQFINELKVYNPLNAAMLEKADLLYQRALFANEQQALLQLKQHLKSHAKTLSRLNWPQ